MKNLRIPASLLAAFLLAGCQTTPAMLEKKEQGPVPASLADELPADTVLYFAMPDVAAMRANLRRSSLAKIYHEPAMQEFLAGGLGMLEEAWEELRAQAAQTGVPAELLHWDTLRSFEFGAALRVAPGAGATFERPPEIEGRARLGLAPGTGTAVFDLLLGMLENHHDGAVFEDGGTRTLTIEESLEEGAPLRVVLRGRDDSVTLEFQWGGAGAGRLSDNLAFRRAWHRNAADGTAAYGYFRAHELFALLYDGLRGEQPQAADVVAEFYDAALRPVEAVAFASGWDEAGSFTHASLDLTEDAGPLWRTEPADRALAARVPAAATGFFLSSSRTADWMRLVMRTIDRAGAFVPPESPMPLAQVMQAGVPELHSWIFGAHRPELDRALASVGARSFGYTVPTGGIASETLTFVELTDPEGMSAVLEQLMPRLREAIRNADSPARIEMRRLRLKQEQPDGAVAEVTGPAYYWLEFDFPTEFQQMLGFLGQSFQPCFAVAPEGWLVFSTSRDSVRRVLSDGMTAPERSILDNAEAARFLAGAPKSAHTLAWSDPRPGLRELLGMVGGMLPMLGSVLQGQLGEGAPMPLDLAAFPDPEVFVRNLRPQEAVAYPWLGDHRSSLVGSFGFADLFTVVGGLVAIAPPILAALETRAEVPTILATPPAAPPDLIEF